jgi:hypothetical protein
MPSHNPQNPHNSRRGFFRGLLAGAISTVATPVVARSIPSPAPAKTRTTGPWSFVITRDMTKDALRMLGVLGPGEEASDADMVFCYRIAARLRESWLGGPVIEREFVAELARDLSLFYSPRRPSSLWIRIRTRSRAGN